MAIQVRRGNESDFNASKMLPGEWAVSLDTKYVRMCFAPGVVLRMATYEGFEADKAQIQAILAECRSIQSAVQRIQAEVNSKASLTIENANSAKESADKAYSEAERAKTYADNAEAVTGVSIATQERAGLIKGGDNYISEDGTLELIKETTSTTLPNSYAGRFKFDEIGGVCEQGENPSPTNQQEIKKSVVSGVKTHGKNMLNPTLQTTTLSGVTCTRNGDGTYTLNGTATAQPWLVAGTVSLKANKPYRVCGTPKNVTSCGIYVEGVDSPRDSGNGFIYTPSKDIVKKIYISVALGENITNALFKPMVTEDLEATYETFEPYQGTEITFSQPIELYGIGDVQDVIEDGVIKRRHKSVTNRTFSVIDGYDVGGSKLMVAQIADKAPESWSYNLYHSLCTKLPAKNMLSLDEDGFYLFNYAIYARIAGCSDVNEFNAKMSDAVFVYELATPTTEALPIADQIALNSLQTYDGITYVEFDSEIQPTFKGEYGTSKVGGYTLEGMLAGRNGELYGKDYNSRLSALEASVVNNI